MIRNLPTVHESLQLLEIARRRLNISRSKYESVIAIGPVSVKRHSRNDTAKVEFHFSQNLFTALGEVNKLFTR
jgi:hypothetical protein